MFPNPEIFGIEFQWYSLWHRIAIMVTILFALLYLIKKKPLTMNLFQFVIFAIGLLVLGYTGARFLSVLDTWTDTKKLVSLNELFLNVSSGRLRWYGALLFILAGFPIINKAIKATVGLKVLDFAALNLCLFTAIVKQACLFAGDGCYGIYTNLPWGMYFPYGSAPTLLPVHPTPLYDTIFHLFFFIFLLRLNNRKKFDGQTAFLFFGGTATFNILLEFIRINPIVVLGLTLSQLTYILILLTSLIYYRILTNNPTYKSFTIPN